MQRLFAAILVMLAVACNPSVSEPRPSDAGTLAEVAQFVPPAPRLDVAGSTAAARERQQVRHRHGATNRLLGAKRPDDRITACTRTATDKASLMACLDALTRPQPVIAPGKLGALGAPIVNPAWSITDWYVNPSTGSNDNTCVASGSPCKTASEIIYGRWGTYFPQISVGVTIHILADTPANTDYLTLEPAIVPGGSLAIIGTPTTTCSGHTLASVTAKNRGAVADGRLSADLGACATGAQGLLIVNSTRSSSVAWVDSCSGTVCKLTQPIAENVPTFNQGFPPPGEFDTWANGDSFTTLTPPKINLVSFKPTGSGNNAATTFQAGGYVGKVWVANNDTGDAGAATSLRVNALDSFIETRIDSFVEQEDSFVNDNENEFGNSWLSQGAQAPNTAVRGGAFGTLQTLYVTALSGLATDDVVLHGLVAFGQRVSDITLFGSIYADGTVSFFNDAFLLGDVTPAIMYGTYTIQGGFETPSATMLTYLAPAATAFGGVPTWQYCGGSALATAYDRTVTPAQWYPHRTLSDTNLDGTISGKPGSGFSGLAVCDNGSTVASSTAQVTGSPSDRFVAGSNITLTENSPATGQLTIAAASGAVSSVSGTSGVSCSPTTGAVVCSNTGATSVTGSGLVSCSPTTGAVTCSATDPAQVAHGGTSSTSLTAHDLIVGNGTSAVNFLAPGAGGNFARSNGTDWFSSALPTWYYAANSGTANNPCDTTIFAGVTVTVPATGAIVDVTAALTVNLVGTPQCTLNWGVAIDNTACSFSVNTSVSTNSTGFAGSALTYETTFGSAGSHTFDIQAGSTGGSGCATIPINDAHLTVVAH